MPRFRLRTLLILFVALAGLLAMLCQAVLQVREASRSISCRNNLRQIVLSMQNFESSYGHLPVGIETNEDGTARRSWRTWLYPMFMEQSQQFYDPEFAWDAPENARLFNGTPVIATDKGSNPRKIVLDPCPEWPWCCPADSKRRVNYSVVVGEETAFPIDRPIKLEEITDGLENTILIVETLAGSSIWTEPRELNFEELKFLIKNGGDKGLSSRHRNGIHVAFADGAVFFLKDTIPADELKALLTIAGDEPVTRQQLIARGLLQ